jgi:DNA invertase Pin-like site-specific DNA recombinase
MNMAAATPAIAYLRTSSATNVGGDSDARQRTAIQAHARSAGFRIVQEFWDQAVSGADPLDTRPGFQALLAWAAEHPDVRTIIVETASRLARDLVVAETGHAMLTGAGFTLIAADDPDGFTSDTPTAVLIRQILGAVSQFEKTMVVAKLQGARDRRSLAIGRRVEGRRSHVESNPELLRQVRRLYRRNPITGKRRSLRAIAAELEATGCTTAAGTRFSAGQVQRFLDARPRPSKAA